MVVTPQKHTQFAQVFNIFVVAATFTQNNFVKVGMNIEFVS